MAILTDDNYVDKAEKVIKSLNHTKDHRNNKIKFFLTTTKIRNLLNLTSNLFDESKVRSYKELADKIAYLRVQFVYQSGRETAVKDLVKKAEILDILKEINNKESLQRFCRYMEALVAYFRFYGGKD
ncbi:MULTISPECIES: type III-A CRISPR-associated protein Csm2 [Streptococcus]|jgi:CRISPR-associated protein, csm2 family|uniref:type III-A CRISPR-associated protein Csm2 n=1 Tax=Streptococcus TaxID=1301 RepID=UPI0001F89AF5|nr:MULTISPECIES: type III-A CRISPR-associated protein Csm2 [Streptococcus]EFX56788.1 CRISPR-associated protein, Csm2 family [Streptococcus sp. C300]KXT89755.1 CRISPR-associated protein, Csm2 family [Streptococcus oralis]MBN6014078.1 type III-A CRISPR-associated protein Csm2 [Streptococcus oralis subsp. oralis]OFL47535.1 type III-A CRISPR-associated protein Csm2 [Streptococcus sp. HMSC076C08]OFO18771.1 type III-A CRISPR-associated protein Csm2 [Streptococcus sp. HMSC072D05]